MGLITRAGKGSELSIEEMDGNLTYLAGTLSGSIQITGSIISDINSTGNITAVSMSGDGSGLTGVTGEWDGTHVGDASITGSLTVTGGVSGSVSLSDGQTIEALNGGGFLDLRAFNTDGIILLDTDGGNFQSSYLYLVSGSGGEATLKGPDPNNVLSFTNNSFSLTTGGDITISGSTIRPQDPDVMDIGSPSRKYKVIYGVTGSFSHLQGNSPITVQDSITFQSAITASGNISASAISTASFGTYLGDGSQLSGISSTPFPFAGDAQISGSLLIANQADPEDIYFRAYDTSGDYSIYIDEQRQVSGRAQLYVGANDKNFNNGNPVVSGYNNVSSSMSLYTDRGIYANGNIYGNNIILSGQITASGNISSSADIYGTTGSFGTIVLTSPNGTKYSFSTNNSGHLQLTGSIVP